MDAFSEAARAVWAGRVGRAILRRVIDSAS